MAVNLKISTNHLEAQGTTLINHHLCICELMELMKQLSQSTTAQSTIQQQQKKVHTEPNSDQKSAGKFTEDLTTATASAVEQLTTWNQSTRSNFTETQYLTAQVGGLTAQLADTTTLLNNQGHVVEELGAAITKLEERFERLTIGNPTPHDPTIIRNILNHGCADVACSSQYTPPNVASGADAMLIESSSNRNHQQCQRSPGVNICHPHCRQHQLDYSNSISSSSYSGSDNVLTTSNSTYQQGVHYGTDLGIVTVYMKAVVQVRVDLATIKTLCLKLAKCSGFGTGRGLVYNIGY
ncbi:hypothetical protein DSO57_1029696 [Entomophthora muscae]|uniref:Uncharacterized protein n=1 Tax=Entomophthora muscae TaxID=34485 RepID=A0ACC2RFR3_9FUNG|nr:hypothetical protein DSO57_1029696 [Entomophthora muscae]